MRRRIMVLLLSLIALVFLGSLQNLAESRARRTIGSTLTSQPSPAGPLALDEAITFTFNRRVDCVEAEAAFTWQPAIRGRVTCDEYSLAFEPLDQYERDTSYTFAFAPPLQAKDGAPLLDPYRATYLSAAIWKWRKFSRSPKAIPCRSIPPSPSYSIVLSCRFLHQ